MNGYLTGEQVAQLLKRTSPPTASGCVLWTGCVNREGYGVVRVGGKTHLTHRLAYSLFVGELVPGLQIDHLCKVRRCMAPAHLDQVTAKVNTERSNAGRVTGARNAAKTHCPHGHEYDEANTYRAPSAPTQRVCRECSRRRFREWDARRKAERVA